MLYFNKLQVVKNTGFTVMDDKHCILSSEVGKLSWLPKLLFILFHSHYKKDFPINKSEICLWSHSVSFCKWYMYNKRHCKLCILCPIPIIYSNAKLKGCHWLYTVKEIIHRNVWEWLAGGEWWLSMRTDRPCPPWHPSCVPPSQTACMASWNHTHSLNEP